MKKLNLHLDELAVESFATGEGDELRGTVRGHGDSSGCSYGGAGYTGCRLSCMYECGESDDCTPACPGGGTGGGGTGGGGTGGSFDPSCRTGCRLSCGFPC